MGKFSEEKPHKAERNKFREMGDAILFGIALLPSHFGIMLSIIVSVMVVSVMTPAQLEVIQIPITNGIAVAFMYYIVVNLARTWTGNTRGASGVGIVSPGMVANVATSRIPLSEDEMMRFAIHEAGHIISLKLFPEKPRLVKAYVREYVSNPNGNVYYQFDAPLDRDYSWAHMLNTLAGQIAESVINDDYKVGSESDNKNWEQQAKRHMNSGFSCEYYCCLHM